MDVDMAAMKVIMTIIYMIGVVDIGIEEGIRHFNIIYPIRYGKNHVELNGIVVGEQDVKAGHFGRIAQIPIIQFTWKGKNYEIADETNYLVKICKIGDEVIVCFNPTENVAIIKKGEIFL